MFYRQMITNFESPIATHSVLGTEEVSPGERKLAIILPVDRSSPDLCKVIVSAAALGYPAPIIVNWKKDFHTDEDGIGPSQLGKISGTLDYLDWATREDIAENDRLGEDDLVLMLDAHDVWLQLPPSVLLKRYFESNKLANARLAREVGFFDSDLMQQTVVVSAQKGCVAPRDSVSDLHCDDVPESTLPTNVYGILTDYKIRGWKFTRPKYVNSGSFMGPVGDMKRYFRRVKDRMDENLQELAEDQELAGDQGIFAEVFGKQEVWRQQVRELHLAGDKAQKGVTALLRQRFEYHVGLDYAQQLFYPTCYSERDGYFVSLGDVKAVNRMSRKLGVWPSRIQGVPRDIDEAGFPLAELDEPTRETSWGDLPLYTDFWTTAIPVALHHNAWKDGLKSRRVTWWDKTWYFPYLRSLLEAHLQSTESSPLMSLQTENGSLNVWPYGGHRRSRRAALLFGKSKGGEDWILRETDWDSVCRNDNETAEGEAPWYNEVFRDGKGIV